MVLSNRKTFKPTIGRVASRYADAISITVSYDTFIYTYGKLRRSYEPFITNYNYLKTIKTINFHKNLFN